MLFKKVQKSSLTDQVSDILYQKIVNGEIAPGEQLPSETELSEQLGVARPTIREALNRLIGLGLVTRGGYTKVVSTNASMSARAGLTPLFLDKWEGSELYEARILIETDLIELVIQNATENDIERLRQINAEIIQGQMTEQDYYDVDMKFHSCLAEICGNKIMNEISRTVNDMFCRYKPQVAQLHEIQKITYHEHELLINAIENQDLVEARSIIQRTLSRSERAIKNLTK